MVVSERSAAIVALEWLLVVVHNHMMLQMVLSCKCQGTVRTTPGALVCMRDAMIDELGDIAEPLVALITRLWFPLFFVPVFFIDIVLVGINIRVAVGRVAVL